MLSPIGAIARFATGSVSLEESLHALFIVLFVAMLAPLIGDYVPWIRIPVVVIEVVLGIIVGPDLLDLVRIDSGIDALAALGLAFLFFLAGYEIDFDRVKGKPLALALKGWAVGLAIAFALGGLLQVTGKVDAMVYVGIAIATTAVGTLMPILSDEGVLDSHFGTHALAVGAVGEFGPIILVALLLDPGRGDVASALVLNLFILLVIVGIVLARRWHSDRLANLIARTMNTSGQFAVRIAMFLVIGLVYAAERLDLDFLLGAFGAGIIVGQAMKRVPIAQHERLEMVKAKFEGIGFGFLIPVFFVVTGIKFQLRTLLDHPGSLAMVPLFLLCFLLVRGAPVLLLHRSVLPEKSDRRALAILAGTEFPLVIAVTALGVEAGAMPVDLAAAMVGAAMLSVLLFPMLGLALRKRDMPARSETAPVGD